MSTVEKNASHTSASTGTPGLDDIMAGGFASRRLFLVEGMPGSGRTTLALQYAIDGARRGESVLYITLSETEEELRAGAESAGFDHHLVKPPDVDKLRDLLTADWSSSGPADGSDRD